MQCIFTKSHFGYKLTFAQTRQIFIPNPIYKLPQNVILYQISFEIQLCPVLVTVPTTEVPTVTQCSGDGEKHLANLAKSPTIYQCTGRTCGTHTHTVLNSLQVCTCSTLMCAVHNPRNYLQKNGDQSMIGNTRGNLL